MEVLFCLDVIDLVIVLVQHQRNIQVAVEGTDIINELLLIGIGLHSDSVHQIKQSTEIGGLDTAQLPTGGVFSMTLSNRPL